MMYNTHMKKYTNQLIFTPVTNIFFTQIKKEYYESFAQQLALCLLPAPQGNHSLTCNNIN